MTRFDPPSPPDPDPREDEPECICGDQNDTTPDCYYHGVDADERKLRTAKGE